MLSLRAICILSPDQSVPVETAVKRGRSPPAISGGVEASFCIDMRGTLGTIFGSCGSDTFLVLFVRYLPVLTCPMVAPLTPPSDVAVGSSIFVVCIFPQGGELQTEHRRDVRA